MRHTQIKSYFLRLIPILLLTSNLTISYASDANLLKPRINQWIHWLNKIVNPTNSFTKEELKEYYSPSIKVYTNGVLVAKGYDELYKQYVALRNQYQSVHIELPFKNIVVDGRKAAIQCVIKLHNANHKQKINDVAMIDFDKTGKIIKLWELLDSDDPVSPS